MQQHDRIFNFTVTGGTFTYVHGSYYHIHNPHQELGLLALSQAISTSAIHDSAMRNAAGKCHPGTREEIIKTILEWINDPSPSADILWLCGPAGSGKSAIMHTIAEKLDESHKEQYGGSFFFARGVRGLDHGDALFSTLSYQLATNFPPLREPINHAMVINLALPSKSMKVQLNSLIVQPFTSCPGPPLPTPTIVIDGLDECGDSRTQREILTLIANARISNGVPLRFLISSRPEFWIRDTFDRSPLCDIMRRLNLSDSVIDAYKDIKKYLQDGFKNIYESNLDIMSRVQKPWPSEDVISDLAYNASGQFIYASTVLKFVGGSSDFSDPQRQLEILSKPGPLQASAFSDLDQLYRTILSLYPRRGRLTHILGGLIGYPYPEFLEVYLDIDAAELNLVLRAISSLIQPKYRDKSSKAELDLIYGCPLEEIEFCHLSFPQFLEDKTRSGPFFIDVQAVSDNLFARLQDILLGSLNRACDNRIILGYPCISLFMHVSAGPLDLFIKNLRMVLQKFSRRRPSLQTLQVMRYLRDHLWDTCRWRDEDLNTEITYQEISQRIDQLIDECLEEILSESSLPVFENIMYFVGDNWSSRTLDEIALLPGFSKESAETFLTHNAPLIEPVTKQVHSPFIRTYHLPSDVYSFLSTESRAGRFHHDFRRHFIRICRYFLMFLLETSGNDGSHVDQPQWKHTHFILVEFLKNRSVSDLRRMEDTGDITNFQQFIESLCTGNNYKKLRGTDYFGSPGNGLQEIVGWLHRQLNQQPPSVVLEESIGKNLKQKMLNTVEQIYETVILPFFNIPFYSDNEEEEQHWLSSLRFPPHFEHLPHDKSYIAPYKIRSRGLMDYLRGSGSELITALLMEDVTIYPHINLPQISAHLLEDYLTSYATHLHRLIGTDLSDKKYDYPERPPFALWFAYANPTKKIQAALWTLYYVCSKETLPWRPPPGFCVGAMDFLEKYELDQGGELTRWFEDLTPRQLREDSHREDWIEVPEWLQSS